jgi:hypothetical protein
MSPALAAICLAAPLGSALAGVGRSLIQHRTERQRLDLVERLAARHGIAAVSALGQIIPPEIPRGLVPARPGRGRPKR